jgi:hypothetical protein
VNPCKDPLPGISPQQNHPALLKAPTHLSPVRDVSFYVCSPRLTLVHVAAYIPYHSYWTTERKITMTSAKPFARECLSHHQFKPVLVSSQYHTTIKHQAHVPDIAQRLLNPTRIPQELSARAYPILTTHS